jgi:replicative DNA helicase
MLENKLLGIVLNNPELFNTLKFHGNIFHGAKQRILYKYIEKIYKKNNGYTSDILLHTIDECQGLNLNDYYEIYESDFREEYFDIYMSEILTRNYKLEIKELASKISVDGDINYQDIKIKLENFLAEIKDHNEKDIEDMKNSCIIALEELRDDVKIRKILSGFDLIDTNQLGYDETDFVIIAGGESSGKTSIVVDKSVEQLKSGLKVGIISCEMSKNKITKLFAANIAGVDLNRVELKCASNEEKENYIKAVSKLYELPLYIDDSTRCWDKIKKKIKILILQKKVDIVYIDHIHYISQDQKRNKYDQLSTISAETKDLAKSLKTPIVQLAQLSREGKKADRPPNNSDIKWCSDIEQDADHIIMIERVSNAVNGNAAIREVKIHHTKNRNGRIGNTSCNFFTETRRFRKTKY